MLVLIVRRKLAKLLSGLQKAQLQVTDKVLGDAHVATKRAGAAAAHPSTESLPEMVAIGMAKVEGTSLTTIDCDGLSTEKPSAGATVPGNNVKASPETTLAPLPNTTDIRFRL
jgi:hypothetical protein